MCFDAIVQFRIYTIDGWGKIENQTKRGLDNKQIIISVLPNIGITILMIFVFFFMHVNIWKFMLIFAGITAAIEIYKTIKAHSPADRSSKKSIMNIIKSGLYAGALYLFIGFFGKFGVVRYFIICFSIAGIQLWRGRKLFMQGIRDIETQIFGKTLDKENWRRKNMWKIIKCKGCGSQDKPLHQMQPSLSADDCYCPDCKVKVMQERART